MGILLGHWGTVGVMQQRLVSPIIAGTGSPASPESTVSPHVLVILGVQGKCLDPTILHDQLRFICHPQNHSRTETAPRRFDCTHPGSSYSLREPMNQVQVLLAQQLRHW